MAGVCPAVSANGGQTDAHAPRHVTFLALSGANTYKVRPWVLTRTVPSPGSVLVEMCTTPLAGTLDVLDADGAEADDLLDWVLELPQPAANSPIEGASSIIASSFLTGTSLTLWRTQTLLRRA